jgi:ketoreductase RED1
MQALGDDPGRPAQTPDQQERLIEAVEKAYGSSTYSELAETRDRKQLAVLDALAGAGRPAGTTTPKEEN